MEYIKIDAGEQRDAQKHLLTIQLSTLTILKRYERYKKLRREELMLKTALRRALVEANEHLVILDKMLPKAKLHETEQDKTRMLVENKPRADLEVEVSEIQRKLDRLNNNY